MSAEKDLIDAIVRLSGKYSGYEVFADWVKCSALSVANSCHMIHGDIWKERERDWENTISRYTEDERVEFARMFAMLVGALEDDMRDVLGEVYMEAGLGSKMAGQFFTPFHVSELCAKMGIEHIEPDSFEPILINEPSCGGGSMIIATAAELQRKGVNWQRRMRVVAQDLDWKGVYMCYLQLSLLGMRAKVVQGDTLLHPYDRYKTDSRNVFVTPGEMIGGFL